MSSITVSAPDFRALVEHLPVAAYACDPEGRILWHNQDAVKLWGRQPGPEDRFCGAFRAMNPDGSPLTPEDCYILASLKGRRECEREIMFERPDRTRRFIAATARPVFDSSNTVVGVVAALVDRTPEREIAQAEQFLSEAIDQTDDAIITFTTDARVRTWNRGAERIFGFSAREMVGRTLEAITPSEHRAEGRAIIEKVLTGEVVRTKGFRRHKNGTPLTIAITSCPAFDQSGRVSGICGMARDITDLETTRRRYEMLAETSPCMVFHTDRHGRPSYVNDARWTELTGRPAGAWAGDRWAEALHPDDRDRIFESWTRAAETGAPHWEEEHRFQHVDGTSTWVLSRAKPLYNENGELESFTGACTEISAQKEAEEALRQANDALEEHVAERTAEISAKIEQLTAASQELMETGLAIENSMAGISQLDADGKFAVVRDGYARMLGYQPDEMIGMGWEPTVAEAERPDAIATYHEMVAEGRAEAELEAVRKDGSRFIKHILLVRRDAPDGGFAGHYCFMRDVTERRAAEAELRLRNCAIDATVAGIAITDPTQPDNPVIDCNPALLRITGYSREEIVGRNCRFLQSDDREQSELKELRTAIKEGRECRVTLRNYRKNGELFWNELVLSPVKDAAGRLTNFVGVINDVTEQRQTAAALGQEQARTDQILTTAMDGYILADLSGVIRDVNPAYCAMVGRSHDDLVGQNLRTLEAAHIPAQVEQRINTLQECGRASFESQHRHRDGHLIDLEVSLSVLPNNDDPLVVGFVRDITTRKLAEQSLLLTQFSVDRSAAAVFWVEPDASFSYVNDAACTSLGYTRQELLQRGVFDIDIEFPPEKWEELWSQAKSGQIIVVESEHRRKNGDSFPSEITINLLDYGGIQKMVAQVRNVSDRKEAEQRLAERSEFERLLLNLSAKFVTSDPGDLEEAIVVALEAAGRFADADRSYVFLFSDDRTTVCNTHEWCAEGIEPQRERFQDLSVAEIPWVAAQLLAGQCVNCNACQPLPAEARVDRQFFEKHAINSVAALPIRFAGEVVGFLGFDASGSCRCTDEPIQALMRIIGDMFIDAKRRLEAEASLRASEEKWRSLVDNAPSYISLIDPDYRLKFVNRIEEGFSEETLLGASVLDFVPANDQPRAIQMLEKVFIDQESHHYEMPDISGNWYSTHLAPVIHDGEVTAAICIANDITANRQVQQELEDKSVLLDEAQRLAKLGNWEWDLVSNQVKWSDELCQIYGYDPTDFDPSLDRLVSGVHPDDRATMQEALERVVTSGGGFELEQRITRADDVGERVLDSFGFAVQDEDGKVVKLRVACQDVTDRKRAELRLRQSLREKEILLREIHHRVKNNLQIVSSLLHFQGRKLTDPAAQALIHQGQERLRAMILVHEQLYGSGDLSRIDFGEYLRRLAGDLQRSRQGGSTIDVVFHVPAHVIFLPIETALPAGMIVNELVTNAYKHAFPERNPGTIEIGLEQSSHALTLSVSDNGRGLPDTVQTENPQTFGMQLIGSLSRQINAELVFDSLHGTRAVLRLPPATENESAP